MAGLIGFGQAQRGRAANTLSKSAEMEFQRNQGNMATDAAESAQKKTTMGLGAGMAASQAAKTAIPQALQKAGLEAGAQAVSAGAVEGGAAHLAAVEGATTGISGAMTSVGAAIPHIAAGIAIAALFNKIF